MKDRSFLYELRAYLIYVKVGEIYLLNLLSWQYRISLVIRREFFSFQNNPKDLDPSCKTDLDLWYCLGRVKLV